MVQLDKKTQTHIEIGRRANREMTVTNIMVVEYGGSEGGNGRAVAKSRKPLHTLWTKKRRVAMLAFWWCDNVEATVGVCVVLRRAL